ncbi:MAG: hypothetical protein IJ220_09360 [Clostridia bacterium]|nr:hypothetical protein [Clostridia bacterium]
MNYINELIKGNKTIEELKKEYREAILIAMKQFIDDMEKQKKNSSVVTYSKDDYEAFRKNSSILQYMNYEDMIELLKIEEDSHLDFSKTRVNERYSAISNKILTRRLANDLYDETVQLYDSDDTQTNNEKRADIVYQYLQMVGYNGESDEHIPELVRGNFKLSQTKSNSIEYTKTIIEIELRMKYLLRYLSSQSNRQFTLSKDSLLYLLKGRRINDIAREMYGNTKSFEKIVQEKLSERTPLYAEVDAKRSLHRELDVYNDCQRICDELTTNPAKEVNEDTYQRLADLWLDSKSKVHPTIRSGFQQYKDIVGLRYVRVKAYKEMEQLSEKLLNSRRIKNFFKYSFEENDEYDSLLKKMVLLDEVRKDREKPTPEFALLDATEKAAKTIWDFSGKVADVTLAGIDKTIDATKKMIKTYRLNRPTQNAVIYIGKHVLVEKVESKSDDCSQKQMKNVKKTICPTKKANKEDSDFGDK